MSDPTQPEVEPDQPVDPAVSAGDDGRLAPVPSDGPPADTTPLAAPHVRGTRAGRTWVGIAVGLVILVLLLVFVFQNLHDTTIQFFTAKGSLPVALGLIFAAIAGALVVLLVGSVRIVQLRRHVRASYRAGADDARGGVAPPPPPGRRSRRRRD